LLAKVTKIKDIGNKGEQMEIDFEKGLESKEQAQIVVKQVQQAIDDLTIANQKLLKQCDKQADQMNEMGALNKQLTESNINLADVIKTVHMLLNANFELVSQDKKLKELTMELGKWVMGSGAIKLGVLSGSSDE